MVKLPVNEIAWPRKVRTPADAARFINGVGFCTLFAVKKVPLPSLYYAVTRRAPAVWDSTTEKIWGWKDELPRMRRAVYTKYFRARGTFISLEMLPHFLASRGSPTRVEDCERFYSAGRVTRNAYEVWRALAEHGPLPTLELRHACKMESKAGNARYKQAMLELQCLLVVTHFGTEKETAAWPSSRFDLIARAFSKQAAAARKIEPQRARIAIAQRFLAMHPQTEVKVTASLFGWSKAEAEQAAASCGKGMAGASSRTPRRRDS